MDINCAYQCSDYGRGEKLLLKDGSRNAFFRTVDGYFPGGTAFPARFRASNEVRLERTLAAQSPEKVADDNDVLHTRGARWSWWLQSQ